MVVLVLLYRDLLIHLRHDEAPVLLESMALLLVLHELPHDLLLVADLLPAHTELAEEDTVLEGGASAKGIRALANVLHKALS